MTTPKLTLAVLLFGGAVLSSTAALTAWRVPPATHHPQSPAVAADPSVLSQVARAQAAAAFAQRSNPPVAALCGF